MNPFLPALALTACFSLGLYGLALARRPPAAAGRFPLEQGTRRARRSLIARISERIGQRYAGTVLQVMSPRRRAFLTQRLEAAGRPTTLEGYAAQKAATVALYLSAGVLVGVVTAQPLLAVLLAALGWFTTDVRFARLAKRRQAVIEADLPDFLDVLAVVVGAGSSFRQGLARVAEALEGPLGDEILLTLRQMDLGTSRRRAFEGLRDRNTSESLDKLVTALLQAEELGAPLTSVLGDISVDMRQEFQQNARRRAAEATPRVGLIVTTVVLPGAMVLILTGIVLSSGSLGLF